MNKHASAICKHLAVGHLEKPGPGARNGQVPAGGQKSARIGLIPFAGGRFGSPDGFPEIPAWAGCPDRMSKKCFSSMQNMLQNKQKMLQNEQIMLQNEQIMFQNEQIMLQNEQILLQHEQKIFQQCVKHASE